MATETRHSGTLRTDYEANRARTDSLQALTADTDILLHRLIRASKTTAYRDADGREGTLTPLLENHVLTVLADIRRKKLSGYGGSFAESQGTARQAGYVRKLTDDVESWRRRLEAFLRTSWQTAGKDSVATETARELSDKLRQCLESTDPNQRYYRMLRTVKEIQANADRYQERIEASGDTEPAIALLLAHLKNYASVAEAFNHRLAELPKIYRKEILHVKPTAATPDNAYIVVTPATSNSPIKGIAGFTLKEGTAFAAGEDLTYKTTKDEYISPMRCMAGKAVHMDEKGVHIQTLHLEDTSTAETLFEGGEELRTGWQIESPMLVLEEGKREVEVRFLLDEPQPDNGKKRGFTVEYASADGWTNVEAKCKLAGNELTFSITIDREGNAPTPCTQEIHGAETEHPALRIFTTNNDYPAWAEGLTFQEVRISVKASGIRSFTFLNELGETDTTQPFAPFGMQAERGAWFIFGNEETGMKPLKQVTLTGKWQKLPENKSLFNDLYREYGVDASDFTVRTESQKGGDWHKGDNQPLFRFDGNGKMEGMKLLFTFSTNTPATRANGSHYEYARDKDGFFRVTLDSPDIGFGAAAYRERFAEVMIRNSRRKEKDMEALPKEPPVPLLTDVEMEYEAEARVTAPSTRPVGELKITPIALAAGQEAPPREGLGRLLHTYPASSLIYFALDNAPGEKSVRLYIDTTLPKDKIPYYNPSVDGETSLVWQYWNGEDWENIQGKDVTAEETHGLTQSGFVEVRFEKAVPETWLDSQGRLWLRAAVAKKEACLALRGAWTNCIKVTADGGDGTSLPAETIQGTVEEDDRIGSVTQPLPGFGGSPAMTEAQTASQQTARIANRHRAVRAEDYEQILLEHFPEADYVQCFTLPKGGKRKKPEVRVVVFSRQEDGEYFLSPPWKLGEMERMLRRYAPVVVDLKVVNPLYEKVTVECEATLHFSVPDAGKVENDLTAIAETYFMPWKRKGTLPTPGQTYSYKELHARLVNHEDLQRVTSLTVDGREWDKENGKSDTIRGTEPWSVLIPEVTIRLSSPDDGIGGNGIGTDFVVG